MDRPGSDFLFAGGEVGLEAEQLVTGLNQPVEPGRLQPERRQKISAVFRRKLGELRFDLGREGNDFRHFTAFSDRLAQRLEMWTFVARQLSVAHVRRVQDWLHGEQRQRSENRL